MPAATEKSWKDRLAESGLICLSILLAFWLNDWGEERQIAERTQVALCNVKQEMQDNHKKLTEDYLPRHEGLLSYIERTIEQLNQDPPPSEPIPIIDRPIYMEALEDTAWELAIETGYLLHADFTTSAEIARVYSIQQQSFEMTMPRVMDVLYANTTGINRADMETQSALRMLIREMLSQEEYLTFRYEKLLASDVITDIDCSNRE